MMSEEIGLVPEGVPQVLNYGSNKVRFLAPVKSGARVRSRAELIDVTDKGGGRLLLTTRSTVEIEGEETPALVAETLALLLPDAGKSH
jgi:acyl dehydratase